MNYYSLDHWLLALALIAWFILLVRMLLGVKRLW